MTATQAEVDRVNACLAEVTTRVRAHASNGDLTFGRVGSDDAFTFTYDDDLAIAKSLEVAGAQEVCTDCFMVNASRGKREPDPRYDRHSHCGSCPPRPDEEPCCP